ncbi:MAG: ABC transporter substrate-binding protein [Chloroflexi bacterium]|nr:ABC transporter substrate-binding protein [Chloroflexota bacterium]
MKRHAIRFRVLTVITAGLALLLAATACGADEPTPTPLATPTSAGPTPTSAPGAPEPPELWDERKGGTLMFGTSKAVDSPHPFTTTVSVDNYIKQAWLEPLLQLDGGELHPVLATSWVANDDFTTWTFHLRQGVKFHNGQEMTSADVVWTVNYIKEPENAARGHGALGPTVVSIEAVDRYTVRFNMAGRQPAFPLTISEINQLPIVPADSLEPGEILVSTGTPGTGPFMFEEWVPSSKTVVTRFDDYWGGKPYLDKIVFLLISSATGRGNALRTGELDITERLGPTFANRVLSGEIRGLTVDAPALSGYRRILFNTTSPIFSDRNVRLAAVYGMDMQKLLDEAFFGLGALVNLSVPPGSVWDEALKECCPRRVADPDRARELLAASSYGGEPIRLIIQRGREGVGESISRQLREVGFTIDMQVMESAIYGERQISGDFDLTPEGGSFDGDPVLDGHSRWRCEEGDRRISNKSGICNPELDALIDSYFGLVDLDERVEQFKKIYKLFDDEVSVKHMGWNFNRFFGWNANVKGFEHRGEGSYTTKPVGGGLWRVWLEE